MSSNIPNQAPSPPWSMSSRSDALSLLNLLGSCTFSALFRIPLLPANGEALSHVFKQEVELEPWRSCFQPVLKRWHLPMCSLLMWAMGTSFSGYPGIQNYVPTSLESASYATVHLDVNRMWLRVWALDIIPKFVLKKFL